MADTLKVAGVAGAAVAAITAGVLYFASSDAPEKPDAAASEPVRFPVLFQDAFPRQFANAFEERPTATENFGNAFAPATGSAFPSTGGSAFRSGPRAFGASTARTVVRQTFAPARAQTPAPLSARTFESEPAKVEAARVDIGKSQAGYALLQELRQDAPSESAVREKLAVLGVAPADSVAARPPAFLSARLTYRSRVGYEWHDLPFDIIDVATSPDLRALSERLKTMPQQHVVVGFGKLNNIDQPRTERYAEYMRDIRAVVRLVRQQRPDAFVWITACYGVPSYREWVRQMGSLGDGIALWNVAFFPAVGQFENTRKAVQRDAGGRPVMILGFFGSKLNAQKPADFEGQMAAAERMARKAGFAGFVRIDQ